MDQPQKARATAMAGQAAASGSAGQAAVELAIFGAILIFLLGTIVRTAVGNSYNQNQNFKAMRMALLASWNDTKIRNPTNVARNSAAILFVEDRLSPDFNKYGDLDRNPFIAQGSGTFTYNLFYPLSVGEPGSNLPVFDMYINGQHFPFTTASYVQDLTITPTPCSGGPYLNPALAQQQCVQACDPKQQSTAYQQCLQDCQFKYGTQLKQNQCLRNYREWTGGIVYASQFQGIVPVPATVGTTSAQRIAQDQANANAIFNGLATSSLITLDAGGAMKGKVNTLGNPLQVWAGFQSWFTSTLSGTSTEVNTIKGILQSNDHPHKLFYTMVPNGTNEFTLTPPACSSSSSCVNKALTSGIETTDYQGNLGEWNNNPHQGDMMFDLSRNADYTAVETQLPIVTSCPTTSVLSESSTYLRCNLAWQWAATAATSADNIGLNPPTNYPSYDIDGRLKEQTIYDFKISSDGFPTVSYGDNQGGDIDSTWDANSPSPKPGLQNNSEIFTFTKDGTYLQIKEGKLYNPETGQFVRSVNQRDNVDIVQRQIQLSNNTGRFCDGTNETPPAYIGRCLIKPSNLKGPDCTASDATYAECNCIPQGGAVPMTYSGTANVDWGESADFVPDPNPVELCVSEAGSKDNCFYMDNIKKTCLDTKDNMLFVRSRLEDRRGYSWITNASGQLNIK